MALTLLSQINITRNCVFAGAASARDTILPSRFSRTFTSSTSNLARSPTSSKSANKQQQLIAGHATPNDTSTYASFFKDIPFVKIPASNLSASRLGMGTHRVSGQPSELDAIKLALRGGVNVIDTASWFEQAKSEKAVGKALADLLKPGSEASLSLEIRGLASKDPPNLSRSNLIILTKCGAIPPSLGPDVPPTIPTYTINNTPTRHSIDPDFLDWSIDRSRRLLGVQVIDCFGIDGVEQLFKGSGLRESTVWDLLESAVAYLEKEAEKGERIKGWFLGSSAIAGASLPNADKAKDGVLSLAKVLEIVKKTARNGKETGHMWGLEYPYNIFERSSNQQGGLGEQAKKAGLWQLTNRSLNVVTPSGKVRTLSDGVAGVSRWLAGEPEAAKNEPDPLPALFQLLSQHELLLNTSDPGLALAWSTLVLDNLDALAGNALACRAWVDRKLLPGIDETVGLLLDEDEPAPGREDEMDINEVDGISDDQLEPDVVSELARSYASLLRNRLAPALIALSSKNAALENADLAADLAKFVTSEQRAARKWGAQGWALEYVLDHSNKPGGQDAEVTTLVGMRDPSYVRMGVEVLRTCEKRGLGKEGWGKVMECGALKA